jgi:hypothetical protein
MFVFTTDRKNVVPAKPASPKGPGSAKPAPVEAGVLTTSSRWMGVVTAAPLDGRSRIGSAASSARRRSTAVPHQPQCRIDSGADVRFMSLMLPVRRKDR